MLRPLFIHGVQSMCRNVLKALEIEGHKPNFEMVDERKA